jgi:hypothetical protein
LLRRWHDHGSAAAMPSGGSFLRLEKHAEWLLCLVARQPDLTLDEVVAAKAKRRIAGSRSAVSRFYIRHKITFKKSRRATEQDRADVALARKLWIRRQGLLDPARLVFIDETAADDQDGAAERAMPARHAIGWPCAARPLENHHLRGRSAK